MNDKFKKHAVSTIEFFATTGCNMGCTYCFENTSKHTSVDFNILKTMIDDNLTDNFYVFGGEALLNINLIERAINYVKNKTDIQEKRRQNLLSGLRKITSNGTLIEKNIDKIKELGLNFQISLDGPKHLNDTYRVYKHGRGTYDDVIRGIELLEENKIHWGLHGVLGEDSLRNYAEIVDWHFNLNKKHLGDVDQAIERAQGNWSMPIFEFEFTDEIIDVVLDQLDKAVDWILEQDCTDIQKRKLFDFYIERKGVFGKCGAGRGLKIVDQNNKLYPCHRAVPASSIYGQINGKTTLGDADDVNATINVKPYNNFYDSAVVDGRIYAHDWSIGDSSPDMGWAMWCPVTNIETSKRDNYVNSKYSVFILEINNFVEFIKKTKFKDLANVAYKRNFVQSNADGNF